ncbi:MAG TPA: hypothetical protein VK853_02670 [Ilumatobacteraceae bacterium]|nr:hypothetical protein [Ilumatobacteraceae bacterium]
MADQRRFVCVVSDPETWTRVEPGVRRLPTLVEQYRALASWATRLGGTADAVPLVVDRELPGQEPRSIVDAARSPAVTGLLCFSTECITDGRGFDASIVVNAWPHVEFVGFLVEDLVIADDASLDRVLEMLIVVNEVGERDRDTRWADLVVDESRW